MTEPTPQSYVSPDGMWRWDGTQWVPNTPSGTMPGPPAAALHDAPKKRRYSGWKIAGLSFAGLVLIGAIMPSDEAEPAAAESKPAASETAPVEEVEVPVAGIGEEARDGKFAFTVLDVERGLSSYGDGWLAEDAHGKFTVVTVRVENIGDEAQTFFASNSTGIDGKDRRLDAESIIDDSSLEDINPGNSITANVVFDVAKGERLTAVQFHDSMFSGGVLVSLS